MTVGRPGIRRRDGGSRWSWCPWLMKIASRSANSSAARPHLAADRAVSVAEHRVGEDAQVVDLDQHVEWPRKVWLARAGPAVRPATRLVRCATVIHAAGGGAMRQCAQMGTGARDPGGLGLVFDPGPDCGRKAPGGTRFGPTAGATYGQAGRSWQPRPRPGQELVAERVVQDYPATAVAPAPNPQATASIDAYVRSRRRLPRAASPGGHEARDLSRCRLRTGRNASQTPTVSPSRGSTLRGQRQTSKRTARPPARRRSGRDGRGIRTCPPCGR